MLEGLDKVDWASLRKDYMPPADMAGFENWQPVSVPDAIRRLANGNMGAIQDLFGDDLPPGIFIGRETAYIIPFVLEILEQADKKLQGAIIGTFVRLVDACSHSLPGGSDYEYADDSPFEYAKRCIATYEAIKQGIPLFQQVLTTEGELYVRLNASDLLSRFIEQGRPIVDFFCQCLTKETDESLSAALLYRISQVVTQIPGFKYDEGVAGRRSYLIFVTNFMESTHSMAAKIGAALAAIDIANNNLYLVDPSVIVVPQSAVQTLLDELQRLLSGGEMRPVYMIPPYMESRIIQYLAQSSPDDLMGFLKSSDLHPFHAHLVIRGLLEVWFRRWERTWNMFSYEPQDQHMEFWGRNRPFPDTYFYKEDKRTHDLLFRSEFYKRILTFLVDYDPYWALPTNLLSFFYDLPDSREELRNLIAKS